MNSGNVARAKRGFPAPDIPPTIPSAAEKAAEKEKKKRERKVAKGRREIEEQEAAIKKIVEEGIVVIDWAVGGGAEEGIVEKGIGERDKDEKEKVLREGNREKVMRKMITKEEEEEEEVELVEVGEEMVGEERSEDDEEGDVGLWQCVPARLSVRSMKIKAEESEVKERMKTEFEILNEEEEDKYEEKKVGSKTIGVCRSPKKTKVKGSTKCSEDKKRVRRK